LGVTPGARSSGGVRVQDAKGVMLATMTFPAGVTGAGGPPTIADLDGDGKPDFSTVGAKGYMVFIEDNNAATVDGVSCPMVQ
jgi:hypothetical protein